MDVGAGENTGHRMKCCTTGRVLFSRATCVNFREMMQRVDGRFNGMHLSFIPHHLSEILFLKKSLPGAVCCVY